MRVQELLVVLGLVGLVPRASAQGVEVDHGLVYRRIGARALMLDVYRPRDAGAVARPAVVCVHGGSWDSGDRWQLAEAARDLAGRGFVAATVDYRLSGEAPFPAAVVDVRAAVRWLAARGPRFGLDPARIGVFGPSAGGHLALLVATLPPARGDERPRTVEACAAWCAPADLVRGITDGDAIPAASLAVVERFLGASYGARPDLFTLASPAAHVTRNTPPLFLAYGDHDLVVPFSQANYMMEAAARRGVDATLVRVRNGGHDFDERRADPSRADVWEQTIAFFERRLAPALRADAR